MPDRLAAPAAPDAIDAVILEHVTVVEAEPAAQSSNELAHYVFPLLLAGTMPPPVDQESGRMSTPGPFWPGVLHVQIDVERLKSI